MQQTPSFKAVSGHILIIPARNRIAAQNDVAVMAFVIYRVFSVSMMRPNLIGQIFILRQGRIIFATIEIIIVCTLHLLQKYNIGIKLTQTLAQLVSLKSALEKRFGKKIEATVSVDPQLIGGARVTVGDTVIDASVRGELEAMSSQLRA